MSERTKKRRIKKDEEVVMQHAGEVYRFPKKVAEKYRVDDPCVSAEKVFESINRVHTRPGALLRGIRVRENLRQVDLARMIQVTQSDVSQMESGTRAIGRAVAKRIERCFGVDYRSFLA